jgi:hypothetical protein
MFVDFGIVSPIKCDRIRAYDPLIVKNLGFPPRAPIGSLQKEAIVYDGRKAPSHAFIAFIKAIALIKKNS